MVKLIFSIAIVLVVICDVIATSINRKHKYNSKVWTIITLFTSAILCGLFCTIIFGKVRDPKMMDFILVTAYGSLFASRLFVLHDITNGFKKNNN